MQTPAVLVSLGFQVMDMVSGRLESNPFSLNNLKSFCSKSSFVRPKFETYLTASGWHLKHNKDGTCKYSWDTKTKNVCTVDVRNPNVPFGKPNKIKFGLQTFGFQTFGLFGFTINVRLVESINRTSEIRTVWEWDNFRKRQNPNVRISDTYCTYTESW